MVGSKTFYLLLIGCFFLVALFFYKSENGEKNNATHQIKRSQVKKRIVADEKKWIYAKVGKIKIADNKEQSVAESKLSVEQKKLLETDFSELKKNDSAESLREKLILADRYFPDDNLQSYSDQLLFQKLLGKILSGDLEGQLSKLRELIEELKARNVESYQLSKWDIIVDLNEEKINGDELIDLGRKLEELYPKESGRDQFLQDLFVIASYKKFQENGINLIEDLAYQDNFRLSYLKAMISLSQENLDQVEANLEKVVFSPEANSKTLENSRQALKILQGKKNKVESSQLKEILVPVIELNLSLDQFL